jgi:hypothetical protein
MLTVELLIIQFSNNDYHTALGGSMNVYTAVGAKYSLRKEVGVI